MLIQQMPLSERPRERLLNDGVESLSNDELLAIILRCGTKNYSAKEVALNVLNEYSRIGLLKDASLNKLSHIKGIGLVNSMVLVSCIELGKRIFSPTNKPKIKINNTELVFKYFKNIFLDLKQEIFLVIYLDNKKNLIDYKVLFKGTVNQSIAHPREIFKWAYELSSSSFICVHNHPSGDITPSSFDIDFTNRLLEINKIFDIQMLDHIIIGENNYYSFLEYGLIK